jgi:hypothetical protein
VSGMIHPSGWLLLSLAAPVYARLGLQGARATARRSKGDIASNAHRYLVSVKLKGLYNRVKQHERVKAAFSRLPVALSWQLAAFEDGAVVCSCPHCSY